MKFPTWIQIALDMAGTKEIGGVKHNPKIVALWKTVKASWFNTDETPWCGAFVGHCLAQAGQPILPPSEVGRALAWAKYGDPLEHARVGCIAVKQRKGGGHVFFIVGINPTFTHYAALGGNQDDQVSTVWIAKKDVIAKRWPAAVTVPPRGLPIFNKLKNAGSEA